MKNSLLLVTLFLTLFACNGPENKRLNLSLNGEWQLAITPVLNQLPEAYTATIEVPGLVDLAIPAIEKVETADRIYWHKRSFKSPDQAYGICHLKINKAKYHTWIYVNGKLVGENPYSFTPTELDITENLHAPGVSNDLVIAVGCRNNLPDTVADGNDFEKDYYYPGIYDEVNLIFSDAPFISNVQCAPEIESEKLRVQAEFITGAKEDPFVLSYLVRELVSGRKLTSGELVVTGSKANFAIDMHASRLWSPEDPFLYVLELQTPLDQYSERFGMRSFTFDTEKGVALLNGKPYYLRGTNVCIYRFFDDPERTNQPWQENWTTSLHEQFKSMHWNFIRYCIGFPPERWYDIADSLGILIADEFPLWYGSDPAVIDKLDKNITSAHLAGEYAAWMRERWNHPCVVVWDAQNESVTQLTGEAIDLVRALDLSGRPGENGWSAPRAISDPIESHPYLYTHYFAHRFDPPEDEMLSYFFDTVRIPHNDANEHDPASDGTRYSNPVLINEYGWLWLNRDGSTTRLTEAIYNNAFGEDLSMEDRYEIYARHLAIMTEYWRAHRTAAGVQHFCGLGYSRPLEPRGETSDNFSDINELVFEPNFLEYVKPAFAPVGLMLDVWESSFLAGSSVDKSFYLINDLEASWDGEVKICFEQDGVEINTVLTDVSVNGYESGKHPFSFVVPTKTGIYDMVAQIQFQGESIRSVRKIKVKE